MLGRVGIVDNCEVFFNKCLFANQFDTVIIVQPVEMAEQPKAEAESRSSCSCVSAVPAGLVEAQQEEEEEELHLSSPEG
jgi:hypothetical protein